MLLFEVMLLEGKYDTMFNDEFRKYMKLILGEDKEINDDIEYTIRVLDSKRPDRITWALWRKKQLSISRMILSVNHAAANEVAQGYSIHNVEIEAPVNEEGFSKDEFYKFVEKQLNRINKHISPQEKIKDINDDVISAAGFEDLDYHTIILKLEHYLGLDISKINDYIFKNQDRDELFELFYTYEDEWEKLNGRHIADDSANWKVILDFGDNFKWFDLGVGYCKEESEKMSHCGNWGGRKDSNQTILSLRELVKQKDKTYWKPHLTFIYHINEGALGEMKGYNNQKPESGYHKYIVPLLELDIIKTLHGGGFEPENNFKLSDLSDMEKVASKKPGLANLDEFIQIAEKKNLHWPEGEQYILSLKKGTGDYFKEIYAKKIKKGNWPEMEQKILSERDFYQIISYASSVKDNVWPEGEQAVLTYGTIDEVNEYMVDIMGGDWQEGQARIKELGGE